MTKHIANILTGCRILGSFLLLFFPVFSLGFYVTYLLCGFSDMADGTIARKTNSTSEFGNQLDTIADLFFVVVSLFKLLPAIHIPGWLWIWSGVMWISAARNMKKDKEEKQTTIHLSGLFHGITCGERI